MANDFSTIKENQASEKFLLVRVNPARYVNDSLALDSGTTYTMTFPFDVSSAQEDGSSLTKVTGTPSAGEFSYDESTKLLTVTLNAAPSSTNPIVVFYYIFLTTERVKTVGKDPESPATDLRDWEPRIKTLPSVSQSLRNITNGILSIQGSSISLINNEQEFEQYLTDEDSFYNKSIDIWQILDDIENIKKIFEGFITSLTVSRQTLTLNFKDALQLMSDPALMGDDDVYYNNANPFFTNVDDTKPQRPIPYVFGTVSPHTIVPVSVSGLPFARHLVMDDLLEAVCIDFNGTLSTVNNRDFGLCRVSSNGFEDFGFTPSNIDNTAGAYTRLDGTAADIVKFHIGDTFEVTGSGTYYCTVLYIDRANNYIYVDKQAGMVTSDVVNGNNCPAIVLEQGSVVTRLKYGRDYSATVVTLDSGNKLLRIVFVANFEGPLGLSLLDPTTHRIGYRVKPKNDEQTHGTVLKEMLDKAGFTTNAASFTAANTAFDVNCNFTIPFINESDFSPYTTYVQKLLLSTLGFIYLNNDFEIVYELFSTPSSTDETSDTDILKDTFRVQFQYDDIITKMVAFNSHFNTLEFSEATQTYEDKKVQRLHGITRTTRFDHVLEDFGSKIQDHINLRGNRLAVYTYRTKSKNYESEIGDDVLLSKNNLPGRVGTKSVKIVGLSKKVNETDITAFDLLDL